MILHLSQKRLLMTLLLTVGLLAALFGVWTQHQMGEQEHQKVVLERLSSGYILPSAKPIAPFFLHGTWGGIWDNEALHGHFSVLFFGFTHCPEMCPTTLAQLSKAYERMEQRARAVLPEVIFVSVDPKRDSIQELRRYLSRFNARFKGAVGDDVHLKPLKDSLGVLSMKVAMDHKHHSDMKHGSDAKVMQDYNVDHSGSVLVIDPEGELVATLTPPHEAGALAKDIERVINRYYHPKEHHG